MAGFVAIFASNVVHFNTHCCATVVIHVDTPCSASVCMQTARDTGTSASPNHEQYSAACLRHEAPESKPLQSPQPE